MQLICLSVSHHNTPVEMRECLSMTAEMIVKTAESAPIRAGRFERIRELVFLSTCNRLEVYAIVSLLPSDEKDPDQVFQPLLDYLRVSLDVPTGLLASHFRIFSDIAAADHLFHVAAGLDSIAIGETQILGQVSKALKTALECGNARHVLSSLFRAAIHAGKRVRYETGIGRKSISISSLGVQFAQAALGTLKDRRILVVGAGKIGTHAIKSLLELGARQIILVNRTFQRAAELVTKFDVEALPFERLAEGLNSADVVFTSTSAPHLILHRDFVAEIMSKRTQRPLTFIDLAVPRNVETVVKEIPNVQLFDMDDLQRYVGQVEMSHNPHIEQAKLIVARELAEYEKLLRVVPFIGRLHKKAEQIRQHEVARAVRHLPNKDPVLLAQIDLISRALVRKILHDPTMQLRSETDEETLTDYVETLTRLFDLNDREATSSLNQDRKWRN